MSKEEKNGVINQMNTVNEKRVEDYAYSLKITDTFASYFEELNN